MFSVVRSWSVIVHMFIVDLHFVVSFIFVGVVRVELRLSTSVGSFVGRFGQSSR